MNKLQVFQSKDFGEVRTVWEDGKPLFCGSDVAKALGYARPNDALSAHCRATVKRSTPISGKIQEINFIPEGDVYRLITHSALPSAERFERWVFDEVLPSIRQHGMYATPDTVEAMLSDPDTMIKTLQAFKDERQKRVEAENQIEADKPKVIFAETCQASSDTLLVRDVAKIIGTIGEKRLFQLLRDWKLIYKQDGRNLPYQRYIDCGYFEVSEVPYIADGDVHFSLTTRVTPKGQKYIFYRLGRENGTGIPMKELTRE
jgi:anti-repressor protein